MCFHHYPFIFRQRKSSSVRGRQTEKGAKQKEIHGGKGKENERTHLIKRFHVKNLAFVMKVWSRKCEFQKDFKSFWPILWRWVIKKRFQHFRLLRSPTQEWLKTFMADLLITSFSENLIEAKNHSQRWTRWHQLAAFSEIIHKFSHQLSCTAHQHSVNHLEKILQSAGFSSTFFYLQNNRKTQLVISKSEN